MRVARIIIGRGMFVASAWGIPMVSDVIGLSGPMAYATFGSLVAFTGGMFMHSGVRSSASYR
ncbi:MAG: hypothetical protein IJV90_05380 [Candidatus Methanomethylophilaceae archaeon]|nr:hypothetical protein [Candidatus Methanomethylophilaceae archaeon]